MKKTMLNVKKLFLLTVVAALCLAMLQVVTANASTEDITYYGKKVKHWDGADNNSDTFFSLLDGNLERDLFVDKDSEAHKHTDGDWTISSIENGGNYIFSDSDGHYEIYNMQFVVKRDYTGLGDENPYEFMIRYHTDTLNSDLNGEDFKIRVVYEYFDINKQQWKSNFDEYSWTDKHDDPWCDDETFDMSDECIKHITKDTGYDDIYDSIKAGACRFFISQLWCDTN